MSDFSDTNILRKIFNAIPGILKPVLVRGQRQRWRDDFSGSALSNNWEIVQIGNSQSIAINNSELQISTGTLVGETIIRHKKPFNIPYKIAFIAKVSQRLPSQEFYLEVVDSSGNNVARHLLSGTSTVTSLFQVGNNGFFSTRASMNTAVATSNYGGFEIDANVDEIKFSTRDLNGINGRLAISSLYQKIPDPSLDYFIQIRSLNIAASSNTVFSLDCIALCENEILSTELITARGAKSSNDSIPVAITNLTNVSVNNNPSVSILGIPNVLLSSGYTTEVSLALAANATVTTPARDSINRKTLRVTVQTDQTGNCYIDQSADASVWLDYGAKACVIGINTFTIDMSLRYFRIRYVNGSTSQGLLRIYTSVFSV